MLTESTRSASVELLDTSESTDNSYELFAEVVAVSLEVAEDEFEPSAADTLALWSLNARITPVASDVVVTVMVLLRRLEYFLNGYYVKAPLSWALEIIHLADKLCLIHYHDYIIHPCDLYARRK
jgi:hypothetical protein